MRDAISSASSAVNAALAPYRVALVGLSGVGAPIFFTYWTQTQHLRWLALFIVSMLVLILAAATPARYAKVALLSTVPSAIHRALQLSSDERVTIHMVTNRRRERYEQIVDYYPSSFAGGGRRFSFSHGIVGQVVKQRVWHWWAVPQGQTFEQAMEHRWGFSKDELKRLTQDRLSFFAYPIGESGQYARAVVYIDSPDRSRFEEVGATKTEQTIRTVFAPLLQEIFKDLG